MNTLDAPILSTAEVARQAEISESETRQWASELGVVKVGPAYAWTQSDVEELLERLEEDINDDESDDDENDADDSDDEDDESDGDGNEDEDEADWDEEK